MNLPNYLLHRLFPIGSDEKDVLRDMGLLVAIHPSFHSDTITTIKVPVVIVVG